MQTRKNIALWILYDFANSIVSITFFMYFAQWVVIDRGLPDLYFNLTFTISTILLLATAPLTGSLLGRHLRRITGLRWATVVTAVLFALCALAAVYSFDLSALVLYTLGFYAYQLSFTFYTPLLPDITNPKRVGVVSGLGIAANYLGQVTGLVIALPFANGTWQLLAANQRAETLLPATVIFFLLSLPMLIFFHEPKTARADFFLRQEVSTLFRATRALFSIPSVALFLFAYFFFNDSLSTVANNFSIFLQQVWGISDVVKTYLMLGVLLTCIIGGVLWGLISDYIGHKRALMTLLVGWLFLLPLLGLITNFFVFVIAIVLMGLWVGGNWSVSRAVMSYIAPPGQHNLAFAYFGVAERASSLVGPLLWSLLVSDLFVTGPARYRLAMVGITIFIVVGIICLHRVKSDRT